MDAHANFSYGTVVTAPSPGGSGTSLVVGAGQGANFPATPFNATVWADGEIPLVSNAEIVRVTNISGDTFTIEREQEDSSARTIVTGDQIAATVTAKTFTDIEEALVEALDDLSDVVIAGVASGDLVRFNGTNWVNYPDSNFAAASHTHPQGDITDLEDDLATLAAAIMGKADAVHAHAAGDVTSGTFADARIAQSNVTQHQAALAVAASQVTSGTLDDARVAASNVTQHQAALAIAASQVTAGTFGAGDFEFPSDLTVADFIQGTTADGFLDFRGDSGAAFGMRLRDDGRLLLGTTTLPTGNPWVTIVGSVIPQLVVSNVLTDSTTKAGYLAVPSWDSDEEPVQIFGTFNAELLNIVQFGGGAGTLNAATIIQFYVASAMNTLTGTLALQMSSGLADFSLPLMADYFRVEQNTPAQLTANTDNYDPGLFGTLRLSSDASRNLTGISGGAEGRQLRLINVGAQNIVLVNDTTSTAANRFLTGTGADVTMLPLDVIDLEYDATSSRWRIVSHY